MKAKKDPDQLVESITVDAGQQSVAFDLTAPLYALQWLKGHMVIGGGSPPGFGQGRPLGFIKLNKTDPKKSTNRYVQTGEENIEMMSRIVPFKGGSHIAACVFAESLTFEMLNHEDMSTKTLARYTKHRDLPKEDAGDRVIALSPSGRVAVVTTDSYALHVVVLEDSPTGETLYRARPAAVFVGHTKTINAIAVSPLAAPEGVRYSPTKPTPLLIASVSNDGTLRLWRTGDIPAQPSADWVKEIYTASVPAGVITMTQPLQYPHNDDPQKRFRLRVVRFSDNGTQLHTVMTRGDGPSFLVSYAISWEKGPGEGKSYSMKCRTTLSVMIDKSDAVTAMEMTPCGKYIVLGTADHCDVAVVSRDGDITTRLRGYHTGPLNQIAVHSLGPNRILLATCGMGDTLVKVKEVHLLQGMKAADVLKVASSLLVLLLSVAAALWMHADEESQQCFLSKIFKSTGEGVPASVQYISSKVGSEDIPEILAKMFDQRTLLFMSFKDPVVLLQLIGMPIAALVLTVLACAGTFDFMLFTWVSFATGAYIGEGFLHLLPLAHTEHNHHYFLVVLGLLFFFDSSTRAPPTDPSLAQGAVSLDKKKGVKLGMHIDQGNVVFVVDKGSVSHRAGVKVGMKILNVNGGPVKEGEALKTLAGLPEGGFTMDTIDTVLERNVALPLDDAARMAILTTVVQHIALLLLFATRSKQHAFLYSAHAVIYEVSGAALLLACNFDALETLLIRLVCGLALWLVAPTKILTVAAVNVLAPWVFPFAAACLVYLSVAHLLPAAVQSEKYGFFGTLVQFFMVFMGMAVHILIGY